MQLREHLPYDVRDVMRSLPKDGKVRHIFRQFVINTRENGMARSVKRLAERLGVSVIEVSLRKGMNGRLIPDPFSQAGYCIEVSDRLSVEAKRFAVLHELGHLFLHTGSDDPLSAPSYFDPSGQTFYVDLAEEREANSFAEAILFGDGQLSAAFTEFGPDIIKLANYFGVRPKVVEIALSKLRR